MLFRVKCYTNRYYRGAEVRGGRPSECKRYGRRFDFTTNCISIIFRLFLNILYILNIHMYLYIKLLRYFVMADKTQTILLEIYWIFRNLRFDRMDIRLMCLWGRQRERETQTQTLFIVDTNKICRRRRWDDSYHINYINVIISNYIT